MYHLPGFARRFPNGTKAAVSCKFVKRTHFIPLFAAGCRLSGCGSNAPEVSTADWQKFTHRDGFSIKVPATWKSFKLETQGDVNRAKAYAEANPSLKKLVNGLLNVQEVRFVAIDETDGVGMNITRTNNLFHDLKIEELKDKLVTSTKDSFPWVGLPEAGIADLPSGQAVLIRGLLPQTIGENERVEQYSFNRKNFIFTIAFMSLESNEDKLSKYARPIVGTFEAEK